MEGQKKNIRLIVDSDINFLNTLKAHPKASVLPVLVTSDWKKAQLSLADSNQNFSAVFIDPKLKSGYAYSVIRFAHRFRPTTPIFLIHNGEETGLSKKDLHHLGVHDFVKKEEDVSIFFELPKSGATQFDPETALKLSKMIAEEVEEELVADHTAFVPILAQNFLAGSTSYFDIYVRLGSGRYLKILKLGDSFSHERLTNYLKKGVQFFYLRKEAQELYIGYCDRLSRAINGKAEISFGTKSKYTLNHGQEITSFMASNGVDSTYLSHADHFIKNAHQIVLESKKDNVYIDELLSHISAYEHGVGTTMIACILAQAMGMQSDNPVRIIGMAGLLHDVGLLQLPVELHGENEGAFTSAQLKLFQTHPILGAEILKGVKGVEPITVQAVLQHHERKNRSGFPHRIGMGSINKVAEIVGLADEFNQMVKKGKTATEFKPIEEMQKHLKHRFSQQAIDAFVSVFVKKEPVKK